MIALQMLAASHDEITASGALLALILLAAVLGGLGARTIRVPKVVGFLVAGVVLRVFVVQAIGNSEVGEHAVVIAANTLQPVKMLALGLILFSIGGVFERNHLRIVGPKVFRTSLSEVSGVFLLVGGGCALASLVGGDVTLPQALSSGMVLGTLAIATAPAATVLVMREYESKGSVSDAIQSLTALNNVTCIVLFNVVFILLATVGTIATAGEGSAHLWFGLFTTTVGSVALGTLVGFVLSVLYAKVSTAEFTLILLGTMIALGQGAVFLAASVHLSYSFLLACLAAGAVFANIAVDQDRLHESLRGLTGPIFAAFFVLAGYELHLSDLGDFGIVGAAYVVFRVLGKVVGGYVGTRWSDSGGEIPPYIGLGLLCQAGVAIGLVDFLQAAWGAMSGDGFVTDPVAVKLKTIVVGSIVLFELAGPLVLKTTVVRSGEVKAITLLRRHRTETQTSRSVTRLAWDALLRAVGVRSGGDDSSEVIQVRHLMRSNIKFIPPSAKLDQVLRYVETSRYNDFPVADDEGMFVGMVHFSELRKIIYDPTLRELVTAIDLADPESHLIPQDMSLEALLDAFRDADTGLLPVVDAAGSRKIIGVVEQRDLLRALHKGDDADDEGH